LGTPLQPSSDPSWGPPPAGGGSGRQCSSFPCKQSLGSGFKVWLSADDKPLVAAVRGAIQATGPSPPPLSVLFPRQAPSIIPIYYPVLCKHAFSRGVSLFGQTIIASGFCRLSRALSHFLGHFCSRLGCKGPLVFNKFLPSDVCPPSARDISRALGEHSYPWATVWNSVSRLRCGTLPCRQPRCRATRSITSNRPAHRKHPKLDSFCYKICCSTGCVVYICV